MNLCIESFQLILKKEQEEGNKKNTRKTNLVNTEKAIYKERERGISGLIKRATCLMSNHIFLFLNVLPSLCDRQHLSEKQNYIYTHGKSIFYSNHLDACVKITFTSIKFKRCESI